MKPRLLDGYLFGEDGQGTGFHSRYRFVNAAGLSAQLLHRLVPLLDGTRDIEEIAQATEIEPADVRAIVDMMAEAGLIADSSAVYPECGLDAQWRALAWTRAPGASLAADRLNAVCIGVTAAVDPTALTDALRLHGMKTVSVTDLNDPALSGISHLVAIAAGENPSHFETVDAWSRERSVPWVRVVLEPERVRVGPLFLGRTQPVTLVSPPGCCPLLRARNSTGISSASGPPRRRPMRVGSPAPCILPPGSLRWS